MCGGYDLECADAANVLYYINPPSWEQMYSKSKLVYHKSSNTVHDGSDLYGVQKIV